MLQLTRQFLPGYFHSRLSALAVRQHQSCSLNHSWVWTFLLRGLLARAEERAAHRATPVRFPRQCCLSTCPICATCTGTKSTLLAENAFKTGLPIVAIRLLST